MKYFKIKAFALLFLLLLGGYLLYIYLESANFKIYLYDSHHNKNVGNQDIEGTYFKDWSYYDDVEKFLNGLTNLSDGEAGDELRKFYLNNKNIDFDDNKFNKLKFSNTQFKILSGLHSCYGNFDKSINENIDYYYNLDIDEKSGGNDFDILHRYSGDQCNSPIFFDFYQCTTVFQEELLNLLMDYRSNIIDASLLEKKIKEYQMNNSENSLEKTFFSQYFHYSLLNKIMNPNDCFSFLKY